MYCQTNLQIEIARRREFVSNGMGTARALGQFARGRLHRLWDRRSEGASDRLPSPLKRVDVRGHRLRSIKS
jgi:hypothetical protein